MPSYEELWNTGLVGSSIGIGSALKRSAQSCGASSQSRAGNSEGVHYDGRCQLEISLYEAASMFAMPVTQNREGPACLRLFTRIILCSDKSSLPQVGAFRKTVPRYIQLGRELGS